MSAEARPISPGRFAQALEDLPVENLYSKAHEIHNSIQHLQRSNAQLQEYSDSIKNDVSLSHQARSEGDRDCLEAIAENQVVIDRQRARVSLLKAEVERRGGRWHEGETPTNGLPAADSVPQEATPDDSTVANHRPQTTRLSDEELRRRLEEQLATEDDEGLHL